MLREPTSISELVRARGEELGERVFIQTYSSISNTITGELSFAGFARKVAEARAVLMKLGVGRNDRVAFYCQVTGTSYYAYSVAAASMCTCVNLNWRQAKEVLLSAVTTSSSTFLVAEAPYTEDARWKPTPLT